MAPELQAAVELLIEVIVDLKKGSKSGGVVSALMADAALVSKVELILSKVGSLPADVKALSAADIMPLLQVLVPGIEAIIAA